MNNDSARRGVCVGAVPAAGAGRAKIRHLHLLRARSYRLIRIDIELDRKLAHSERVACILSRDDRFNTHRILA